jgi:hypothetical protein
LERLFVIVVGTSDASIATEYLTRLSQERGDGLSAEIRTVNDRLAVIEEAIRLLPDLEFVRTASLGSR